MLVARSFFCLGLRLKHKLVWIRSKIEIETQMNEIETQAGKIETQSRRIETQTGLE